MTMKVAYLVPPISRPNGWRSHAAGFLQAVSRLVAPVLFVARQDEQAAAEMFPDFERFVLPVVQYPFQVNARYMQMAAALNAIRAGRFPRVDLVHSLEAYPAGLFGSLLAGKFGCPHVLTAHGTYGVLAHRSRIHRALYSLALRRAAAICPVSSFTGEYIAALFPHEAQRLIIRPILNGNDHYRKIPREEALRRQPAEIPTVLSVGAVKPRKGYHVSLEAFALLKRRLPQARYWIVGACDDRKYTGRLEATIAAYRLDGVHFWGQAPDSQLHACYREAAVFLLTPQEIDMHFEGFGLVYLEAGAYGLPAVGARSGGVASAIRHGETGLVVDPGDTAGLADALYLLLTDRERAAQMGWENRLWAETLTWEKNAAEHYALYQEILAQPSPRN